MTSSTNTTSWRATVRLTGSRRSLAITRGVARDFDDRLTITAREATTSIQMSRWRYRRPAECHLANDTRTTPVTSAADARWNYPPTLRLDYDDDDDGGGAKLHGTASQALLHFATIYSFWQKCRPKMLLTTRCLGVTGGGSVGECGSWLLGAL